MSEGVLILGGGPAGLGAAYRLSRGGDADVRLLEQGDGFGGNARTIAWNGHRIDLGSHRLPANGDSRILDDLRSLLDGDLLTRPRRARVRVLGRWVRHPLRPRWLLRRAPNDRYLYPRHGIGQVSDRLAEAARERGADLRVRHRVTKVTEVEGGIEVTAAHRGTRVSFRADRVLSTLPVTHLVRMLRPRPPATILAAAERIRFHGLVLVFLEFAVDRFSEFDAYHLPSDHSRVVRITEPKVFADRREPAGRTVLTAEIPCMPGGETWSRSDVELAALATGDLARAGLALPGLPTAVHVIRLPQAMPVLGPESDVPLALIRRYLSERERITSLGNQGSFLSGGTLSALASAYQAVAALAKG